MSFVLTLNAILRHVKYQDRICYLCILPSRFVPTQPFLEKKKILKVCISPLTT